MNKGRLFIISGPSGSGKDTVLNEVFKARCDIAFSISSITREMRKGETAGEKYNFISRDKFERMIKDDELLEYNVYLENYYGTPKAPVLECIENGKDMFVEVDVNGAEKIRKKIPQAVSIFIMPPSLKILEHRLSKRGTETQEIVNKRISEALSEIKRAVEYDYIVINDALEDAVEDVLKIIDADRLKTDRNIEFISNVVK